MGYIATKPRRCSIRGNWATSKSPGTRLFFVLPRAWTDAVLPLDVSQEADVERTLIGRIEMVTPEHRRLLERIGRTPLASLDWYKAAPDRDSLSESFRRLYEGRVSVADVGIELPSEYRDYLALGRFRNALILDSLAQQPNPGLQAFADAYRLRYYDPE